MDAWKTLLDTRLNLTVRVKNPWFWAGLAGVFITALNITPETVTTWPALGLALREAAANPAALAAALVAVLGVVIDPTTAGVGDSKQALLYKEPKK